MHKMQTKEGKISEKALPEIGDKGLFIQELEDGPLRDHVDFIVHRSKICQPVFIVVIALELFLREDPSDVIVLKDGLKVETVKET